ncbi:MAG TPA: hypothetical protein VFG10_15235 [Saprospiraceae bacterium]|nr:hypothetical protein [Saprospiraceae bacterium]
MRLNLSIVFILLSAIASFGQSSPATGKEAFSSQLFKTQMEVILKDFSKGFSNLVSGIIEEDEELEFAVFSTFVKLGNADTLYIDSDVYSATNTFYAGFPGSADHEIALKSYRGLVNQIDLLKFPYCPFYNSEDQVDGNKHNMLFITDTSNKNLDPAYKNLIISVKLVEDTKLNADGQFLWIPVIEIHG